MKSMRLSPFHTAFVISLTFLFGYIVLASMGYMLSIEPGLTIGGISRWCERIVDGIFREPANALSNLGFMIAGLLMFKKLTNDEATNSSKNNFTSLNKLSVLYA